MQDWLTELQVHFSQFMGNKQSWLLIVQVFTIVFLTLLARYFQTRIFRKLLTKAEKTHNVWDDALIYAVNKPLGYLIWLFGLVFAANVVAENFEEHVIFDLIDPIRRVGMILLLSWSLIRLLHRMEINLTKPSTGKRKPVNKTTAQAISRLLRISVVITTALVILQIFNIPIGGIMALGGAGSVVLGFASKDLLANFFGGLMIFTDRPFSVGDWIYLPEKNLEGTVESIGWRSTRVRGFDKRPMYIPNGLFTTLIITNPSRMSNRRIKAVFGLRYQDADKVPAISKAVEEMLKSHPEIDPNQTTFVAMTKFNDSTLDILVYTFTKTTVWVPFQKIQEEVFLKIAEIVKQHGADMAFPTRTLDISNEVVAAFRQ